MSFMLRFKKVVYTSLITYCCIVSSLAYAQVATQPLNDSTGSIERQYLVQERLAELKQQLQESIFDAIPNLWYVPELFSVQHQYMRYGHQRVSRLVHTFIKKALDDNFGYNKDQLIIKKMNEECKRDSLGIYCSHACIFIDEELLLLLGLESPEVDFLVKHAFEWYKNNNHLKIMALRIGSAGLHSYMISKISGHLFDQSVNFLFPGEPIRGASQGFTAVSLNLLTGKVIKPMGRFIGNGLYFEAVDSIYHSVSRSIIGKPLADHVMKRYSDWFYKKTDIAAAGSASQACRMLESIYNTVLFNNFDSNLLHIIQRIEAVKT